MQSKSESPTADEISCRDCQASNSSQRKFCSECGASLWTVCHKCDAEVTVSERFCGHCGVNLKEHQEGQLASFRRHVEEANAKAKDQDFDHALVILKSLIREAGPGLKKEVDELKALVSVWETARDDVAVDSANHFASAQQAFENCQFGQAIELIEKIPAALQTDAMLALHTDSKRKLVEIEQLRGEIEAAIAAKKTADLLPQLERLCQLSPQDPKPLKTAEAIRNQLAAAAKKRLDAGHFDEAWSVITRLRPFVESEVTAQLRSSIETVCWLTRNLRVSPFVDQTLVDSATRFAKHHPAHPLAKKYYPDVMARAKKAAAMKPAKLLPLGKFQSGIEMGNSVDYLPWYEVFSGQEQLVAEGGPFSARMAIAVGLALHGLGRAELSFDLAGQKKGGLFARVTRGVGKKKETSAVGLHFGTTSLKMIRLEAADGKVTPVIQDSRIIPYSTPLSSTVNDFERRDQVRNALSELLHQVKLDDARVVMSFATIASLSRYTALPAMEEKKLNAAIELELSHQIPFKLDEVNFEYELYEQGNEQGTRHLFCVAMKKSELSTYLELVESLGVKPVVQTEGLALFNLIQFLRQSPTSAGTRLIDPQEVVALCYSGGDGSQLVVSHPQRPWFRYIPQGGVRMTRSVASHLKLTQQQAEDVKRRPAKHSEPMDIYRALSQPVRELFDEVSRTVDVAAKEDSRLWPRRLILAGGNSLLPGIVRTFRAGPAVMQAVTSAEESKLASEALIDD